LALPLVLIGEAVGSSLLGHSGSTSAKGLLGNAIGDASFGLQLKQKLDQSAANPSDPISQLAALLQSGTPLNTIINRVAQQVSGALSKATGDGNAERQQTLQNALASALAPPGTSPPGQTGTAEVLSLSKGASLEVKLQNLLETITRELNDAGQQNRFSGAVLDANSAKEIPAQQQTNEHAGVMPAAAPLGLAASVLQNVVQQIQAAAQQNTAQATQQSAPKNATASPSQIAANIPSQVTTQSADVLGRMLARAANADVQRAPAPAAAPAAAAQAPAPQNGLNAPSQLFARLMTVIAQNSNQQTASGGDGRPSQQFAFGKDALPATHLSTSSNAQTVSAPAFSTALTNASAPAAQSTASAATPYTIDPQSVIEQIVQSISLRNFGGSSQVRMQLQPEHLGDVSLKLTVNGNTISANIVAQNADVRDMLLANQQQLARTLSEAGLSLGNFSVDVSGGNAGFTQQQTAQQHSIAKTSALHLGSVADDETPTESRFGPPLLVGAKPWVLNYLA